MQIIQNIDVDGITIKFNAQNKLEAQPVTQTIVQQVNVEIEEVTGTPDFIVTKDDKLYPVSKLGRIKDTDWLVFQLSAEEVSPFPTFKVEDTGSLPVIVLENGLVESSTSEASFRFVYEGRGDMSLYKEAGYKVYGKVVNKADGLVIYEGVLPETEQDRTFISIDGKTTFSEISHIWLQNIVGKPSGTVIQLYVYLMDSEGNKVYSISGDVPFAEVTTRTEVMM